MSTDTPDWGLTDEDRERLADIYNERKKHGQQSKEKLDLASLRLEIVIKTHIDGVEEFTIDEAASWVEHERATVRRRLKDLRDEGFLTARGGSSGTPLVYTVVDPDDR